MNNTNNQKNKITLELLDSEKTIALCGGPYSNYASVEKFLELTKHIAYRFCLGDMGGFGPHPDKTIDLLRSAGVICLKGNYDHSVGFGEVDCGCGYIDPRDRHFAQLSFDYTFKKTSVRNRLWLQTLPDEIEIKWHNKTVILVHGSPDSVNEFVWESEADETKMSKWFSEKNAEVICCTHSGIPWSKSINDKTWFNVGVLGRPAHENSARVFYGTLTQDNNDLRATLVPMDYDYSQVLSDMKSENLPQEFQESLTTGLWTTCSNIMPPEELKAKKRI